jgi:hypothetical protein
LFLYLFFSFQDYSGLYDNAVLSVIHESRRLTHTCKALA